MNRSGGAEASGWHADAPVVVVADGIEGRRSTSARALGRAGYQVLEAATVPEALACWQAANPDVVVIDVDLDGGAGLDALAQICGAGHPPGQREPSTAVITLSADPGPASAIESLRLGSWEHVRTPFAPAELVARVDAVLRLADERERLRRRTEELEYLGSVDALTGLANRRVVEEELARQAAAAVRHHQALSVVLLAVDRWSDLSSSGPRITDAILREVAILIAAVARTGDMAGRVSDNEFLVVLPMTDSDGVRVFAERVRSVVAAAPIDTDRGPVDVSISAGCATGAPDAAALLARAVAGLRQAQSAGGDGLVLISS